MSNAAIASIHVDATGAEQHGVDQHDAHQHGVDPGLAPDPRRHLRALPTPSVRRAPRLVHGVLALAGLAGIVAAQLGLTVVISEGAYTLNALGGESSALARTEQALGEDVAVLASPQHVAVAADELGMLAGQPSQFLTLSGTATAGGPDALHMQVPALDRFGMYVPNALLQTQPQIAATVEQVREEIAPYPGMLLPAGEGAPAAAATDDAGAAAAATTETGAAAAEAAQPAPGTLLPAAPGE
ncbi:hypothetical protein SAMN04487783_2367 [Agrococcus baldri]|uniref:Uncharacterized protein n=1 Tax=Agrococcus baldri TaxID=153730 RepID=A0AA94L0B2_9MICO|nr:hypothetical protein [Agrococcus baldri]SFS17598.1 hypothetical protein SAMN04487783_2367 [Agrococcus baldri]